MSNNNINFSFLAQKQQTANNADQQTPNVSKPSNKQQTRQDIIFQQMLSIVSQTRLACRPVYNGKDHSRQDKQVQAIAFSVGENTIYLVNSLWYKVGTKSDQSIELTINGKEKRNGEKREKTIWLAPLDLERSTSRKMFVSLCDNSDVRSFLGLSENGDLNFAMTSKESTKADSIYVIKGILDQWQRQETIMVNLLAKRQKQLNFWRTFKPSYASLMQTLEGMTPDEQADYITTNSLGLSI